MKKYAMILLLAFFVTAYAIEMPLSEKQQMQTTISMIPSPESLEMQIDPEEYIIGVGDQFIIEKVQDKVIYTLPVFPAGDITIPGGTSINIGGMSLKEAIRLISEEIGPYSNVALYNVKNIRIPISGAVYNPGVYTVSAAWRLSDLLKKTPLNAYSKDFAIEIKSGNTKKIINIYNFYIDGDLESNPYLHAGESVHVPFADAEKECIEVYGPVHFKSPVEFGPEDEVPVSYDHNFNDKGMIPIIPNESLGHFLKRKIQLSEVTSYDEIMIIRNGEQLSISQDKFYDFVLQPGDIIEFKYLKNIMITGHVNSPGTYSFIPGHSVMDYISMAGGVNYKGSDKAAVVIRGNRKIKNIQNLEMKRGDIILVKRSAEDILIGETSILSFISMIASIAATAITAFIAAGSL